MNKRKEKIKIHPGKILLEEFINSKKLSINKVAKEININENHLEEICNGTMDISTDIAYLLATYFQNSVDYWLNLQRDYDLCFWGKELSHVIKEIQPYSN